MIAYIRKALRQVKHVPPSEVYKILNKNDEEHNVIFAFKFLNDCSYRPWLCDLQSYTQEEQEIIVRLIARFLSLLRDSSSLVVEIPDDILNLLISRGFPDMAQNSVLSLQYLLMLESFTRYPPCRKTLSAQVIANIGRGCLCKDITCSLSSGALLNHILLDWATVDDVSARFTSLENATLLTKTLVTAIQRPVYIIVRQWIRLLVSLCECPSYHMFLMEFFLQPASIAALNTTLKRWYADKHIKKNIEIIISYNVDVSYKNIDNK